VDAEELSGLLRDTERRYSTLSCEFSVRFHPDVAARAERQQVEVGKVTLVGLSPDEAFGDWEALGGKVTEYRALVSARHPDCYREQDFDPDEPTLLVRDGASWWCDLAGQISSGSAADGGHPALIGRYEMCVHPESLPDRLGFEVTGAGERVGRQVILANARRLPPRPPVSSTTRIVAVNRTSWFPLPVFSNGEDDYTVEIDAATGVVLRIASVFENRDWMVIEAVSALFDEPLPEEKFMIPKAPVVEGVTKRRGWFRGRQ
jgi:hypothetical protein